MTAWSRVAGALVIAAAAMTAPPAVAAIAPSSEVPFFVYAMGDSYASGEGGAGV